MVMLKVCCLAALAAMACVLEAAPQTLINKQIPLPNTGPAKCSNKILTLSNPLHYCSEKLLRNDLKPGDLCILRTEQVKPTQLSVGKVQVHCALRKIEQKNETELMKYLFKQKVPTVIGPNGGFYITDKHHLSSAMFDANLKDFSGINNRVLIACIINDYSTFNNDMDSFWSKMEKRGMAYLKDEYGLDIPYKRIPLGLKQLQDDPYRTLSRWVRNSNGFIKCSSTYQVNKTIVDIPQCKTQPTPFYIEFFWADFLRQKLKTPSDPSKPPYIHPPLKNFLYQANYQTQAATLKAMYTDAMRLVTDVSEASKIPGFNKSPGLIKLKTIKIDGNGCDEKDIA